MAEKEKPSKADIIREFIAKHPLTKPKEAAETLQELYPDMSFKPGEISVYRSTAKKAAATAAENGAAQPGKNRVAPATRKPRRESEQPQPVTETHASQLANDVEKLMEAVQSLGAAKAKQLIDVLSPEAE